MPLYFVRHGESVANEQNRFAGSLNTPLTKLGVRQAQQTGQRIVDLGLTFDEVHVSTLDRAQHTWRSIAEHLEFPPSRVVTSPRIIERNFGIFAGKNKSLVKKSIGFAAYSEYFHSSTGQPPDGESWREMYDRAKDYYDTVLKPASDAGKTVLVVTHKYIVEMFALVVGQVAPDHYRDLKIPNARPLSEEHLARIAHAPASAKAINDLGELIEIHLPKLVAIAAVVGVFVRLLVPVQIPPLLVPAGISALLAVSTFFGLLRMERDTLWSTKEAISSLPIVLARALSGFAVLFLSHGSTIGTLVGLLLLMPPALLAPHLSLAWGGDYFSSVRQTIFASVTLPVVTVLGLFLTTTDSGQSRAIVGRFVFVLVGALVIPGIAAQAFRWKNPTKAGSLSTNWNWLGSSALIPLAAYSAFVLTPPVLPPAILPALALAATVAAVTLLTRVGIRSYVRWRVRTGRSSETSGVDVFITQTTPNIFLWLSMAAIILPIHGVTAELDMFAVLAFFGAMYLDDLLFVRAHTQKLTQTPPTLRSLTLA